jgi:hypothetical protein
VTFYLPESEWKALRRLSIDVDATIQDLMEQAVGVLLAGKAAKAKAAS